MTAYSIDLGIHPDATGGRTGRDKDDSYPLQVALTQGTLVPEQESGPYTGFTPESLASFSQIKAGDIVIFRLFETRLICRTIGRLLQGVGSFEVTFTNLDGSSTSAPWTSDEAVVAIPKCSTNQLSLAFTSVREGMVLPCYFQRDSSDGIVTYKITQPMRKNPVPYLFSVVVETTLATKPEETGTFYYRDDPEMVISSDDRPGDGEEDRALNQLAGLAATSL